MNTTQNPRQSDTSGGFRNIPAPRRDFAQDNVRQNFNYTDSEARALKLSFDYVATAVNFIIQNMHRPEAMLAAYAQHAPAWFRSHPMNGKQITYAECNDLQDELLRFLRSQVKVPVAPVAAMGARQHA